MLAKATGIVCKTWDPGSLCLYTSTFTFERPPGGHVAMYEEREQPRYLFAPDSIAWLFSPFKQAPMDLHYRHPEDRIVAPVPDKAQGLRGEFIQAVYKRAAELIAAVDAPVVAIGYSFNVHDRTSFHPILSAVERNAVRRVLIVQPEAVALQRRMMSEYPSISWAAEPRTFASWVKAGFPGVGNEGRAGRLARD